MRQIILINVSGADKPGLTSSIAELLSLNGIQILDIGQAVIHETLSLGILIEVPAASGGPQERSPFRRESEPVRLQRARSDGGRGIPGGSAKRID